MARDRRDIHRQFKAVDTAYREGNLDGLKVALCHPAEFPNCLQPHDLGVGDYPLEYAIYWSPLRFIEQLLKIGADPNYPDQAGFPSLIAALSTDRSDKLEILTLLLSHGASVHQRGHNDWTPLHYAVVLHDLEAVRILLAHGADASARTRIDDCSTPAEDAAAAGFVEAVALLRTRDERT